METYEQKVERVAKAIFTGFYKGFYKWKEEAATDWVAGPARAKKLWLDLARLALEEEARDIEVDVSDVEIPKPKRKRKPKPKLTIPMYVGQKVMCRDGKVREVTSYWSGTDSDTGYYDDGTCIWLKGKFNVEASHPRHNKQRAGTTGLSERGTDALYDYEEEA